MLRLILFGWSISVLLLTPAWAQIRKFPYEGLIESDAAYLRSGPGKQFYPTARLNRGSKVTVHRHDPGGWYMVAPLPTSYSWVRSEYVKKTAANRGIITENNVVVRVGSTFGDDTREVEQVRLSKNDQVEILEEKTLSTPTGPVPHLKITPPAGEYRWVSGKFVTPVDQIVKSQQDQNPFAVPSQAKQAAPQEANNANPIAKNNSQNAAMPNVFESPRNKPSDDPAVRRVGPDPAVLISQRDRLDKLDTQFRAMVNGRTQDWNFVSLEQGYRQLQGEAALPAVASQIDLRFAAIDRYQKIKAEYDELVQLTNETKQRDAQLMSIQRQQPGPTPSPVESGEEPIRPVPDPFAQTPNRGNSSPVELPTLEVPTLGNPGGQSIDQSPPTQSQPALTPTPAQPQQPPAARPVPRFDGAGIVQRAAAGGTGTPAYVLVTPQGRVLAFLQPERGVNLESAIGKAMGIYGQRAYRPELRTDLIVVRSLTPVRLAP